MWSGRSWRGEQSASKSLFSSAKETAVFKADSIKGRGCYLEEPLCLHFKGLVLLLDWSCFMQLLNEKHLFGIIPQQQIRFSQDSLTMWESFCDCPDLCSVIKITTLTSALSNALPKENIKNIQICYKLTGFIAPAWFRWFIFPLNSWTQLEINYSTEHFGSSSYPLPLSSVPFRHWQCLILANSSGTFFRGFWKGSHYTKKWNRWTSDKENDCNHGTYFLSLASLVWALKKKALSASTEHFHYWWLESKLKVYL